LPPGYAVDNVVLISSSLWHDYDVNAAAAARAGAIYNYYSSNARSWRASVRHD
jgi:hypothetical protein